MNKIMKPRGHGYELTLDDGSEFSIMNFGSLMESAPEFVKISGIFMGWEAIEIDKDGKLVGEPIRADNEADLIATISLVKE